MEYAIRQGNIEEIEKLLSQGFVPSHNTLDFALENSNSYVINLFLDHNFKVTRRSLDLAIKTGNIDIINRIIEKMGGGQKAKPTDYSLNFAILTKDKDIINRLLAFKAKVNVDSLNLAIETNNIDIVNIIYNAGGRPTGESLNIAVQTNNIDIVNIIYNAGGRPTGESLNIAVQTNNIAIVNYIVSQGYKPSIETFNYTIKTKNIDMFKLLITLPDIDIDNILSSGLIPDLSDYVSDKSLYFNTKDNILHNAIKNNLYDFVEYILSLGAKPHLSSLKTALYYNYIDIAKLIVSNIIITDNDSYNNLLNLLIKNKNIDIAFIEQQINTEFTISSQTLSGIIYDDRDDIFDMILKYYPDINIQHYFEFSIKNIQLNMIKYFFSKGAKITESAKDALFNNIYWFQREDRLIEKLTQIIILFLKNGLIINDELMTSLYKKNSRSFSEYKNILNKYKNNCYIKNSEDLKLDLELIGIISINNKPLDKIESIDELCDLLHNEYKIFVLDGSYPEDNIYDSEIKPKKLHSDEDEVNKCFADKTPNSQEYKNIPQDRYIIFNNRCYYIYDIIKHLMSSLNIKDINSFLMSDYFNQKTLGDLVDPLTDIKYSESFRENGDDHYFEFFQEVRIFIIYLRKLISIDYTKLN
jgi:hypothetical protein